VPSLTNGAGLSRAAPPSIKTGGNEVVSLERPESEMADAYRSLRTALLLSTAETPPQVLLVTSPQPREGKTTTSVNIAVVFAQKNRRVLLVDADLRRADVHRYLRIPPNGGLSAALVGEDPSKFYISHPDLPGLMILPAGKRPPKPPDLLDSDRMRELISLWRQEFHQVIIDSPPVIGLSDAVILATMADTVVLVVRAKQSRRQELCRAQEILVSVDANVGGVIMNDFEARRLGYYGEPSLMEHYFNGNGGRSKNGKG
jgi:capsular exopolysaccharide synthesis family protein